MYLFQPPLFPIHRRRKNVQPLCCKYHHHNILFQRTSSLIMPYLFRDSALDFDNLDKMDLEAALLDPSFFIGFVSPALNTN